MPNTNLNTKVISNSLILRGAQLYLEHEVIPNGELVIEQGRISAINQFSHQANHQTTHNSQVIELDQHHKILPGRIDLHIHGTHGADVMDATPEALHVLQRHLPAEGTTSFLATTMSMSAEQIEAALVNIRQCMRTQHDINTTLGAEILGVHLEGPFIAKAKSGAHQHDYICNPDIALFQGFERAADNFIKLVTVAPEVPGATAFIDYLTTRGIVPSIGHTQASYIQAMDAIEHGCCHATHLFNAMSGLNHRAPGAALAILEQPILAELIADGIHVAPEMLRFAVKTKQREHVCLVTDSMRAKCMGEGTFDLGQQQVIVNGQSARLSDGTLAGSILTMSQACQNMLDFSVCDLFDLMYLCSINPAKQLNLWSSKGSIALKKDADLIVLNEKNELCLTLCRGQIAFQR